MIAKDYKSHSEKITRTFRVHPDIFNLFKAEVSLRHTNFSEVLESLMLDFLKDPDKYKLLK
jgi:hypothetical protein